jgi:hypothetical protein
MTVKNATSHSENDAGSRKVLRRQRKAPTISDVAQHAGVSPMTVSRVINDCTTVRPSTREKVERSIEALNYAPSSAARSLAGGSMCASACSTATLPPPISANSLSDRWSRPVAAARISCSNSSTKAGRPSG